MTIHSRKGNLLDEQGILVQGCNCHGVMGAGIAKAFRAKWPDVYRAYRERYETSGLRLGEAVVVASAADREHASPRYRADLWSAQLPAGVVVVNLMTQHNFGHGTGSVYVDYDALQAGFEAIVAPLARKSGLPVKYPLIGCGLAGGDWTEVARRIELALGDIDSTLITFDA